MKHKLTKLIAVALLVIGLAELQSQTNNTFTDTRDGNVYKYVTIGNQVWMAENLKYLPSVVGPTEGSFSTPYYYVNGYNGNVLTDAKATTNYTSYGVLYNWPAAMNGALSSKAKPSGVKGVCPTGWHLPSDTEWTQLITYLGGDTVAGGKLKEIGAMQSKSPNTATNEVGFSALLGGYRDDKSKFSNIGGFGIWWSATENGNNSAWSQSIHYSNRIIGRNKLEEVMGLSVRCIKD